MNNKQVLSCLLVIFAIRSCQTAGLDTTLLKRYICRSRVDEFRALVPGSCTQYYQCLGGRALVNTCPHFYDATIQKCVSDNPGCVETIKAPLDCDGICSGVSNGNYVVDAKDSSIYYLCQNNEVDEKNVCENGEMFDLVKLECSSPSSCADCATPKPPCESTTTTCKPTTTTCAPTTITCEPTTTTCEPTTTPCTTTTTTCKTTTTTRTKTIRTTTPRTKPTTTRATTTTPCPTTTTPCPTTTTPCTTTTCTTTPCTTTTCTTTTCSSTTTCTTTTTCSSTTTKCSKTTTKAPCSGTTTTTCSTPIVPYKQFGAKLYVNNGITDASHYILPTKMSIQDIQSYTRTGCMNKSEGFLLPSLLRCNEYFICRNDVALLVSCGQKYFNVQTGSCDLPSNTGCIQAN